MSYSQKPKNTRYYENARAPTQFANSDDPTGVNKLLETILNPDCKGPVVPLTDDGLPYAFKKVTSSRTFKKPAGFDIIYFILSTPTNRPGSTRRVYCLLNNVETQAHFLAELRPKYDVTANYTRGFRYAGGIGAVSATRSTSSAAIGGSISALSAATDLVGLELDQETMENIAATFGGVLDVPGDTAVFLQDPLYVAEPGPFNTDAVVTTAESVIKVRTEQQIAMVVINSPAVQIVYDTLFDESFIPRRAIGRWELTFGATYSNDNGAPPVVTGADCDCVTITVWYRSTNTTTWLAQDDPVVYRAVGSHAINTNRLSVSWAVSRFIDDPRDVVRIQVGLQSQFATVLNPEDWDLQLKAQYYDAIGNGVAPCSVLMIRSLADDQEFNVVTVDAYGVMPDVNLATEVLAPVPQASHLDQQRAFAYITNPNSGFHAVRFGETVQIAMSNIDMKDLMRPVQDAYLNMDWRALANLGKAVVRGGLRVATPVAMAFGQPEIAAITAGASRVADKYLNEDFSGVFKGSYYDNADLKPKESATKKGTSRAREILNSARPSDPALRSVASAVTILVDEVDALRSDFDSRAPASSPLVRGGSQDWPGRGHHQHINFHNSGVDGAEDFNDLFGSDVIPEDIAPPAPVDPNGMGGSTHAEYVARLSATAPNVSAFLARRFPNWQGASLQELVGLPAGTKTYSAAFAVRDRTNNGTRMVEFSGRQGHSQIRSRFRGVNPAYIVGWGIGRYASVDSRTGLALLCNVVVSYLPIGDHGYNTYGSVYVDEVLREDHGKFIQSPGISQLLALWGTVYITSSFGEVQSGHSHMLATHGACVGADSSFVIAGTVENNGNGWEVMPSGLGPKIKMCLQQNLSFVGCTLETEQLAGQFAKHNIQYGYLGRSTQLIFQPKVYITGIMPLEFATDALFNLPRPLDAALVQAKADSSAEAVGLVGMTDEDQAVMLNNIRLLKARGELDAQLSGLLGRQERLIQQYEVQGSKVMIKPDQAQIWADVIKTYKNKTSVKKTGTNASARLAAARKLLADTV